MKFLLLLLFSLSCSALAQVVTYEGLPESGIKLIPGSKPGFTTRLEATINQQSINALAPVLPYSLLLENNSVRNILQVTVRAFLTDSGGKTTEHCIVFGRNGYPRDWLSAPGEIILITFPEGGLTTVLRKGMTIPEAGELTEHLNRSLARFVALSKIRIVVDSAVFWDGEVIGPDRLGARIRINAMNAADASVAAMSHEELESVTEPEELETRSDSPSPENMSEQQMFATIYDEQRWRFSQQLSHIPNEWLSHFVQSILTKPYPTAWRKP